jgi:hypothetical protein
MKKRADDRVVDPTQALSQALGARYEARAHYKDELDQRGNDLMTVTDEVGPRSKAYVAAEEKFRRDSSQLGRIQMAVKRPISRWGVRPIVMLIVGIGLAALEAPANKFLFDVALQSSGFVSYCVSAGVTAFLLVLAHFAGRSVRQIWSDYRHKVIWSNVLVFLFAIGIASLIVGILTVARAAFANETGSIDQLLTGIQGNVTQLGPLGALVAALADTSALVLASINLGGIVVTLIIAFFSHDSDRDYDHAQDALDRIEKKLTAIHEAYLKARSRIIKTAAPDLIGFAANYNDANRRVIEIKTRMQMPLDDDDRFVLTDLDQMSEDADRAEEAPSPPEGPAPPSDSPRSAPIPRIEPNVVGLRGRTGTDAQ